MKKLIKVIFILIMMMSTTTVCFGSSAIDPETFEPTYYTDLSETENLGEIILGYITNIAAVSSVVIIAFLGLKFMVGSVEQRAEYKKSFIPLIVGIFLVLGTSTIMNILWNLQGEKEQTEQCEHTAQIICVGGKCGKCGENVLAQGHSWKYIEKTGKLVCQRCGKVEEGPEKIN